MAKDLLQYLDQHYGEFSKGQRAIADYIRAHYEKAAFMTAAKLGAAVGTSESTVVRFAYELGYSGYPAMAEALREMVRSKLTSMERIAITDENFGEKDMLDRVMNGDADSVRATLAGLDRNTFYRAVDSILSAKHIYIIGVRSSSAPASFLAFYLNLMLPGVKQISSNTASEVFEQLLHAGKGDVVIGISFPRYSQRTVKAVRFARSQGAETIAITDTRTSPLAEEADMCLLARGEMFSFVDSLTAPMSLINALIVAVGTRIKNDVYADFEKLEKIWDEYEVYEKIK